MADTALFVGFGVPARAREPQAVELFEEWIGYCSGLRDAGELESFEPVLLDVPWSGLAGFFVLRGEDERLDRLRRDGDFRRLSARAGLVFDGYGAVVAHVGEGLVEQMTLYRSQVEQQLGSG